MHTISPTFPNLCLTRCVFDLTGEEMQRLELDGSPALQTGLSAGETKVLLLIGKSKDLTAILILLVLPLTGNLLLRLVSLVQEETLCLPDFCKLFPIFLLQFGLFLLFENFPSFSDKLLPSSCLSI